MEQQRIVTRTEWLAARTQHLLKEKELTRLQDQVKAERRQLPWVKVEKQYTFDSPHGKKSLADLFAGRSQLIVQHFMFGPGWKEGCIGCSFNADHVESALVHLEHHDVSFVAVARAPLPLIEAYQARMGWRFAWVSSYGSDFNFDYHVSFAPDRPAPDDLYYNYSTRPADSEELSGHTVFYRDSSGEVFHTYSTYGRGDESLINTYNYLDMTPKGRNETGPEYNLTDWVRRHDEYEPHATGSAAWCDQHQARS